MGFLKGFKEELSHAVNEYVNSEEDVEDSSYSASKGAEEALRRKRNEDADREEEQEERYYDEMFDNLPSNKDSSEEDASAASKNEKNSRKRGNNYNADGKVSLKDIAGDIKDKLNDDKLDEMMNGTKGYEADMDEFGYGMKTEYSDNAENKEGLMLASDEVTEITKGTVIDGNIVTDGSANIYGKIKGNLACRGRLFVSGTILGSSRAADITMNNAKIDGDVTSDGNLKIGNGTVIIGNLYGSSAVIAGAVKGDIDVQGPIVIDSTAVIKGNVCSRSIQINNGAAIEGMISQSYAEIDFAALFDKSFEEQDNGGELAGSSNTMVDSETMDNSGFMEDDELMNNSELMGNSEEIEDVE